MADPPKWLEISLVASGELVEAISDVLTQVIPGGVVIERAVTYDSSGEKHASNPEARICGYLQLDDTLEEKRKRIEQFLWHLGMIQSLPEIHMRYIQDENWMEKWKEHYHPILVGDTLLILPPWLKNTHPQRIPICIDPNMAFGTGTHPTTQLSLKLLEYFMQPDADVIDIGCGSGILSIAARLLGARHALAVDIDPLAVQATLENATLNGITNGIECGLGSVREVIQAQFSIQKAPLVLANILAPVIITLINEGLVNLVAPGGMMILSGILAHQASQVLEAGVSQGLTIDKEERAEDWVAFALRKPDR